MPELNLTFLLNIINAKVLINGWMCIRICSLNGWTNFDEIGYRFLG